MFWFCVYSVGTVGESSLSHVVAAWVELSKPLVFYSFSSSPFLDQCFWLEIIAFKNLQWVSASGKYAERESSVRLPE